MKIIVSDSFESNQSFMQKLKQEQIEKARKMKELQMKDRDPSSLKLHQGPRISKQEMFYKYVVPKAHQLFPQFPVEHFSYEVFGNMDRGSTGLDNRRRDDSTFMNAGNEIHDLSEAAQNSFGTPGFDANVERLVQRLHKWYYEESASGELVQRKDLRQVDYEELHRLGIKITPQEGKDFSSSAPLGYYKDVVRDGFRKAYFGYINSGRQNSAELKSWNESRLFIRTYAQEIEFIYNLFKSKQMTSSRERSWTDFATRFLDFAPMFDPKLKEMAIAISETQDEGERRELLKRVA